MKEGGKGREERRGERGGQGSFSNRNVSKIGSYFAKFPGGTQAGGRSYPRTPSLSGPRHQSCGPRHAEGPLTPEHEGSQLGKNSTFLNRRPGPGQ
jgi:hypothetical protein